MAFWKNWFQKKKKTQSEETTLSHSEDEMQQQMVTEKYMHGRPLEQEEIEPIYLTDQKRYVKDCCESILENDQQIKKARLDYEGVTASLTDIQKLDRVGGEEKVRLLDLCKRISHLLQERSAYKNRTYTISAIQMKRFEMYEDELSNAIRKMYQEELFQTAVESDIAHLTEEKEKLYQERKEVAEKQHSLKSMAKVLCFVIVALVALFVVIYMQLHRNMLIPYLGTIFLAAISAGAICVEAQRNRKQMTWNDRKLSKAISLLNRVKVKCVNNLNVLEYDQEKYGVRSAAEFEMLWGEYCKTKEYERKFKQNTEQLHSCHAQLDMMLQEYQIQDREIWQSRVDAILDPREMVEIRHELNSRRQKLRERIDYNQMLKENLVEQIDILMEKYPQNRKELLAIVWEYKDKESPSTEY